MCLHCHICVNKLLVYTLITPIKNMIKAENIILLHYIKCVLWNAPKPLSAEGYEMNQISYEMHQMCQGMRTKSSWSFERFPFRNKIKRNGELKKK